MEKDLDPFGYNLKRAQHALRYAMDRTLMDINLTTPQYAALSELAREQGLSNAELARRCFVTPQTMHQLIGGLELRNLVRRSQHPEHGRVQQVRVTKTGQALLTEARPLVKQVEQTMLHNLSKQDLEQMDSILEKCYVALEKI